MLIKFDKKLIEANPQIFDLIEHSYLSRFVSYILHSDYRKATNLVPWVKEQVDKAQTNELVKTILTQIPTKSNPDEQIIEVLKWVRDNLKYHSDKSSWGMNEYWNTYEETLFRWYVYESSTSVRFVGEGLEPPQDYPNAFHAGDCEDGGLLTYILARCKGIPSNRLFLMAGNVVGGGHLWCTYRPTEYPLNWAFVDWTYWYSNNSIDYRNLYYINGTKIFGYKHHDTQIDGRDANYQSIWFAFNEETSYKELNYSSKNR